MLPGSLPFDQGPLDISLSAQETLGYSSSSQEDFGDSPSTQVSLKLSTCKKGTVQIVSCTQMNFKPPTSCQELGVVASKLQDLFVHLSNMLHKDSIFPHKTPGLS